MTWHARPGGVSSFPNDTAAQWATAWFTPIDYTHLNYLVDNLNYLRNPNTLKLEQTPNTPITVLTTDTFNSIFSGSFTVTGGAYYLMFAADILANTTLPSEALVRIKMISGGTTTYVPFHGGSLTTSVVSFLSAKTSTLYISFSKIVQVTNLLIGGTLTVDVGAVGANVNWNIRNSRLYLREV